MHLLFYFGICVSYKFPTFYQENYFTIITFNYSTHNYYQNILCYEFKAKHKIIYKIILVFLKKITLKLYVTFNQKFYRLVCH